MTAAGQLLSLPVISPARSALREYVPSRHHLGTRNSRQDRIYRLPPRERQGGFTYYSNGYSAVEITSGTIIDLYA